MTSTASNKHTRGAALALAGGIGWGLSGACAQFLFGAYGVSPTWVTAVRMLGAGALLIAVVLARAATRAQLAAMLRDPAAVGRLALFAVAGLMLCQFTYLMAIRHSNAGTATVLQYIGPVLIVLVTCLGARRLPTAREAAAAACVVAGTYLLATHGDPAVMALSPEGLFWGLAAAVTLVLYTMLPGSLMRRFGSLPVVACGMLVGGAALALAGRAWQVAPTIGAGGLDAAGLFVLVGGMVVLGTAVSFTAYLQAVTDIGAPRASLMASVETVSATAFAALWLHTPFAPMDFAGFALIMATVFLLAKRGERPVGSEAPRPD